MANESTGGSNFNIPMGMYQGMPAYDFMLNNYPQYMQNIYGQAQKGIGQFAQTQMQPAVQNTINNLAGRGMINSSVASDTLSNTIRQIANQAQGYQAGMQGQMAGAQAQYPAYAMAPYQMYANMLMGMM